MLERQIRTFTKTKVYVPVKFKFLISQVFAVVWMIFSIYISLPWLMDLSKLISFPLALFVVTGIAYIPGYVNFFMMVSLLIDKQPTFKEEWPVDEVTILIACRNEEKQIGTTLRYVKTQDYTGKINVFVIDNASTDRTGEAAKEEGDKLGIDVRVIEERTPGKHNALNTGLKYVKTKYVLTLDADTLMHRCAIRYIVARMKNTSLDVCAVAGTVLDKNSRENFLTKIQEWDYFLGIASIKRMQGLYQGTLVAQGAFSIYKTDCVKELGGWPDAIGEDIVLTWRMLEKGWRVYFEPLSVAFTEVPAKFIHFQRQRSRWARGMIEAIKAIKPWNQPNKFVMFMTSINLVMPYLDFAYTFFWIPGLIMAFFGYNYIVGLYTLLVLPIALAQNLIQFRYQKRIFDKLNLRVRKNKMGYLFFIFFYQFIMSPISIIGYIQELLSIKRVWK